MWLITVTLVTKWNKVIGVQHVKNTSMRTFWVSRRCISSRSGRVSWRHLVVGAALHSRLAILVCYILADAICRILIHTVSAQAWTVCVMVRLCPLEQIDARCEVVVIWNSVDGQDINSVFPAFPKWDSNNNNIIKIQLYFRPQWVHRKDNTKNVEQ